MFRNVVAWPEVDLENSSSWTREYPVNFMAQEFHVKGVHCFVYPEPTISQSDPPKVNGPVTDREGIPVIAVAEVKFMGLYSAWKNRDATGFLKATLSRHRNRFKYSR